MCNYYKYISLLIFISLFILVTPVYGAINVEKRGKVERHIDGVDIITNPKHKYGVVFLTGEYCKYCIKMKVEVWADKRVDKRLKTLDWYEIDLKKHPRITKEYKIRGLPTTLLIEYTSRNKKKCKIIKRKEGYMSVSEVLLFLRIPKKSTKKSPRKFPRKSPKKMQKRHNFVPLST